MSSEQISKPWEHVAAELRAVREAQQRAWGNIDNTTLGRYLAGDLSGNERQVVETALEELPDLRKLTDLVRDVLNEFEPATAGAPPVPQAVPEPILLPFRAQTRRTLKPRSRQRSALAAAACLLLVLGLTVKLALPGTSSTSGSDRSLAGLSVPDSIEPGTETPFRLARATATRGDPEVALLDFAEVLEKQGQVRAARSKVAAAAATANAVASERKKEGDLASAEQLLLKAHGYCRAKLGSDHPETVRTLSALADVYEAAMRVPPPPPTLHHPVTPPPPAYPPASSNIAFHNPYGMADRNIAPGAVARPKIAPQPLAARKPQELQTVVVPVVTEALRNTNDPPERQRLARTLGRLGPAARDAVPVLVEQLNSATEASTRQAIIEALGEMGPAATPAVPALVASLEGPCPVSREAAASALVRLGPAARKALPELGRLADNNDTLARSVLARLEGPEGRTGVYDACACFSPETVERTRRTITALGNTAGIEVLVESVPNFTDADARKADGKVVPVGPRCVHIVVAQNPPAIRVRVGSELAQRGLKSKRLESTLRADAPEGVDLDKLLQSAITEIKAGSARSDK
jgi:hypothetical protein